MMKALRMLYFYADDLLLALKRTKYRYEPDGTVQVAKNRFTIVFIVCGLISVVIFGILVYWSSRAFAKITNLENDESDYTSLYLTVNLPYMWLFFLVFFLTGYSFSLYIFLIPLLPAYLVRMTAISRTCGHCGYPAKKYYLYQLASVAVSFVVPKLLYLFLDKTTNLSYTLMLNGV